MKRFFQLALLVGALFGLLGQSAAIAMSPHCAVMMDQTAKVQTTKDMSMAACKMDCCANAAPAKHDSKSSNDMMPGCLTMSGCSASLALGDIPAISSHVAMKPVAAIWPLVAQLSGRAVHPDQHPPSILS